METTGIIGIMKGYMGITGYILGFCRDNGTENENYRDYRGHIGVVLEDSMSISMFHAVCGALEGRVFRFGGSCTGSGGIRSIATFHEWLLN